MASIHVDRRLAAVMAMDAVGYSRLMGADEVGTLRALQACRRELVEPAVAAWHGRIVKTTGDGFLVEFASAVDAVACAVAVQRRIAERNAGLPEPQRLLFRIGINLGDVIVEQADIFGDGVNVAARLESLCPPGGLSISRAVHDQIQGALFLPFADQGAQTVKNIPRPVRVFGLTAADIAAAPDLMPAAPAERGRRRAWIAVMLAFLGAIGAGAAWWAVEHGPGTFREIVGRPPAEDRAEVRGTSIAVLPLVSLGQADEGDYFADGLTEDIIAALGRFRDIAVISRGGVFAYKGRNPTPEQVGRELNVRYVVEGSVRRSPERIRISITLTDTARGMLLWSEHYDLAPQDIFQVQDEITRRITGALAVRVTSLELERAAAKPPSSLEAYDLVLQGRDLLSHIKRSSNARARALFERAIELDPNYAVAYVGLGRVDFFAVTQGWTADPGVTLERAERHARKAIALDDLNAAAHALLGNVLVYFGEYERALDELRRAIDLNGSDAESYSGLLGVLLWTGDVQGAIAAGELLAQFRPNLSVIEAFHLATAYLLADRSAEAIRVLRHAVDQGGANPYASAILAAAYAETGRPDEAARHAEAVRRLAPGFSRVEFGSILRDPNHRAKLALALEKAGL